MTEAQWQRQVLELAQLGRWRVAHFRPAQTAKGWRTPVGADGAGFPDLVLTRPPELIFAELKAEKGRTTPAQEAWLEDLQVVADMVAVVEVVAHHVRVFVWRPSDFDEVRRILLERRS